MLLGATLFLKYSLLPLPHHILDSNNRLESNKHLSLTKYDAGTSCSLVQFNHSVIFINCKRFQLQNVKDHALLYDLCDVCNI